MYHVSDQLFTRDKHTKLWCIMCQISCLHEINITMMYHVSNAFQLFGNDSQITKNTASLFYLSVLHVVGCFFFLGGGGGGVTLVCKCLWCCCCNILYASCYCSVFKSVEHSLSCLKCDPMQSLSCIFSLLSLVCRAPALASGSWSQWWCHGANQQKRQRQAEWRLFWAVPTNKWASSWMRDTSTSLLRSVCHPSSRSSENFAGVGVYIHDQMFVCQCSSAKTLRFSWYWVRRQCVQPFPYMCVCCCTYKCCVNHHSSSCTWASGISVMDFVI